MDEIKKPTNAVAEIRTETLNKLVCRGEDVRQSGVIDIFEQHLPPVPKDYVLKNRDRKFVEDALNVAFDLTGGISRLTKGVTRTTASSSNCMPACCQRRRKAQGATVVQIFHNGLTSALDMGDVGDMDDSDDE